MQLIHVKTFTTIRKVTLLLQLVFYIVANSNFVTGDEGNDNELDDLDEDGLDKLFDKYNEIGGIPKDFEKEKADMKKLLFNRHEYITDINEEDDEELDEELARSIFSISESLEFIIDHHNRAKLIETELDKLVSKKDILKRFDEIYKSMEIEYLSFESFVNKVESMMVNPIDTNYTLYANEIKATLKDQFLKFGDHHDRFEEVVTDSEELNAFEDQLIKMHEEREKFSEMATEVLRHISGFTKRSGIDMSLIPKDSFISGGKPVEIYVEILENLLKKYQRLDGLKNNLLLEKEPVKKASTEEEIKALENKLIPEYVDENRGKLSVFMGNTIEIVTRCLKKMFKIDILYFQLRSQINQTEASFDSFLEVMEKYETIIENDDEKVPKMSIVEL